MDMKGNKKEEQEVFNFNFKTIERLLEKELANAITSARNIIVDVVDNTRKIEKEIELKIHMKWDAKFLVIQTFFKQKILEARTKILQSHKSELQINFILQEMDFSYEIKQLVKEIVLEYELDFEQEIYIERELLYIQDRLLKHMKTHITKVFDSIDAYKIDEQKKEINPIGVLSRMTLLLAYYKLRNLLELNEEQLEETIFLHERNLLEQCKTYLLNDEYNSVKKAIKEKYMSSFITEYIKNKQTTLQQFCKITGAIFITQLKELITLESAYLKIKPIEVKLNVEKTAKQIISSIVFSTRKKEEDTKEILQEFLEKGQIDLSEKVKQIPSYVLEALENAKKETEFVLKDKKEEEITISYIQNTVKKELFHFKEIPIELYRI